MPFPGEPRIVVTPATAGGTIATLYTSNRSPSGFTINLSRIAGSGSTAVYCQWIAAL